MPLTNKSAVSVKAFNIQHMTTSVRNTICGPPCSFQLNTYSLWCPHHELEMVMHVTGNAPQLWSTMLESQNQIKKTDSMAWPVSCTIISLA